MSSVNTNTNNNNEEDEQNQNEYDQDNNNNNEEQLEDEQEESSLNQPHKPVKQKKVLKKDWKNPKYQRPKESIDAFAARTERRIARMDEFDREKATKLARDMLLKFADSPCGLPMEDLALCVTEVQMSNGERSLRECNESRDIALLCLQQYGLYDPHKIVTADELP